MKEKWMQEGDCGKKNTDSGSGVGWGGGWVGWCVTKELKTNIILAAAEKMQCLLYFGVCSARQHVPEAGHSIAKWPCTWAWVFFVGVLFESGDASSALGRVAEWTRWIFWGHKFLQILWWIFMHFCHCWDYFVSKMNVDRRLAFNPFTVPAWKISS